MRSDCIIYLKREKGKRATFGQVWPLVGGGGGGGVLPGHSKNPRLFLCNLVM